MSRLAIPDQRRLALVGDADGADVARRDLCRVHGLAGGIERGAPDIFRLVLDEAGRGIVLREFDLAHAADGEGRVEEQCAAGGGALVEGEDQGGHGASVLILPGTMGHVRHSVKGGVCGYPHREE